MMFAPGYQTKPFRLLQSQWQSFTGRYIRSKVELYECIERYIHDCRDINTVTEKSIKPIYTKKIAVVIGSGFGGSVASLRLGEAGIETALVERGLNWQYHGPGTFPLTTGITSGDGRTTWLGDVDAASGMSKMSRYAGLLERVQGDTMPAVCPAGLGGGSLVYGSVLLQPKRDMFAQSLPFIDYDEMDTVYYPRVRAMISGGPIPDDVLQHPQYASVRDAMSTATSAGFEVLRTDVGFDWNIIRQELTGELPAAASVGEYVFGCNSNAKNTLDKNYLKQATNTQKVEVFVQHNVERITQNAAGMYTVHCAVINNVGETLHMHYIDCQYLFMAAGTLNTTKLLLKCKTNGDLPKINKYVGSSFGGNGDELVGRVVFKPFIPRTQGGPPCVVVTDTRNTLKEVGFMHSPSNIHQVPPGVHIQQYMSMSVPDKLGSICYDAVNDKPFVKFPYKDNTNDREAHLESLKKLPHLPFVGILTGSSIGSANEIWHPLGGVVMGKACTLLGELKGQRNLFVVDGSLIPGSTGASNPSLTIAANAERIMDKLMPKLLTRLRV